MNQSNVQKVVDALSRMHTTITKITGALRANVSEDEFIEGLKQSGDKEILEHLKLPGGEEAYRKGWRESQEWGGKA